MALTRLKSPDSFLRILNGVLCFAVGGVSAGKNVKLGADFAMEILGRLPVLLVCGVEKREAEVSTGVAVLSMFLTFLGGLLYQLHKQARDHPHVLEVQPPDILSLAIHLFHMHLCLYLPCPEKATEVQPRNNTEVCSLPLLFPRGNQAKHKQAKDGYPHRKR